MGVAKKVAPMQKMAPTTVGVAKKKKGEPCKDGDGFQCVSRPNRSPLHPGTASRPNQGHQGTIQELHNRFGALQKDNEDGDKRCQGWHLQKGS